MSLEELEQAATPGPWRVVEGEERGDYGSILGRYLDGVYGPQDRRIMEFRDDYGTDSPADAAFIAAIRNVTPELLAVVAAARAVRLRDSEHDYGSLMGDALDALNLALAALDAKDGAS